MMIKTRLNINFYIVILLVNILIFSGCAGLDPKKSPAVAEKKKTEIKSGEANETKPDAVKVEGVKPGSNEIVIDTKGSGKEPSKTVKSENLIQKKSSGVAKSISSYNPLKADSSGDVMLNFDNADLIEVIRTFSEILDFNYTLETDVSGKVTIHTSKGIAKKDVFPVFYQILETNGLTAVKDGDFYRITTFKDTSRLPLRFRSNKDGKEIPPEERMAVQIIPLKHVSAEEMSKVLEPFITEHGTLITHEASNMLLLIEKNSVIQKANYLVDMFDTDNLANSAHRFYKLKYYTPEEMSKLLGDILSAFNKGKKDLVRFVPVSRLSLLIAVSSDAETLKWLDKMISEFDVPGEDGESKIFVYFVKNGLADDIGAILGSVFGIATGGGSPASQKNEAGGTLAQQTQTQQGAAQPQGSTAQANAFLKQPTQPTTQPGLQPLSSGNQAQGVNQQGAAGDLTTTLKGKVKITTDATRNALIIEAMPSDYRLISGVLKILDVLPRQVLIEVTIADISLDDKDDLGVDWSYKAGQGSPGSSILEAVAGSSGFKFVVGEKDRWTATLAALASKKKAKILSAPSVLASDNKEAKIDISDEIPVVSTEYSATTTGSTPVFQSNVQYKKTGIILSVTPHINENGLVSMKLNQEVSNVGDGVMAAGKEYTSFRKRTVTTDLTVANNQTIVIGGLMKEERSKGNTGVPILSSIPLIGFLFGKQTESVNKSELMLLITPKVINTLESVDKMTEAYRNKVEKVFMAEEPKQ